LADEMDEDAPEKKGDDDDPLATEVVAPKKPI